MRKRTLLLAVIMILPLILAACGGNVDADEFEDAFLKAVQDGDPGDLNELLCEDDQLSTEDAEAVAEVFGQAEEMTFECEANGDTMECEWSFTAFGETTTQEVNGNIDGDVICGFEDLG